MCRPSHRDGSHQVRKYTVSALRAEMANQIPSELHARNFSLPHKSRAVQSAVLELGVTVYDGTMAAKPAHPHSPFVL